MTFGGTPDLFRMTLVGSFDTVDSSVVEYTPGLLDKCSSSNDSDSYKLDDNSSQYSYLDESKMPDLVYRHCNSDWDSLDGSKVPDLVYKYHNSSEDSSGNKYKLSHSKQTSTPVRVVKHVTPGVYT